MTTCGKIPFASQMLAANWGTLLELYYRDGIDREAYRCDRCEQTWHVTSHGQAGRAYDAAHPHPPEQHHRR